MYINKSQGQTFEARHSKPDIRGQTFEAIGVDLSVSCFTLLN